MTLVSVQSFGVADPGGGPRILRALLEDAGRDVLSVVTGLNAPAGNGRVPEVYLPLRPRVPKLDGSRFGALAHGLELPFGRVATRRLEAVMRDAGATAVHCVAHGGEFWPAHRAARRLGLPFLLSVHDDLRYLRAGTPRVRETLDRMGAVWREADERFVVSDAIGREYGARWGERPFRIVTDGLRDQEIYASPRPRSDDTLRMYFAGLFHTRYAANLRSLVGGLERAAAAHPNRQVALTLRCGSVRGLPESAIETSVLPFAPEVEVRRDLDRADLLWLPLMFEPESRDMIRFSLSTKLVTYLGSGLPILYHGPAEGAAFELLSRHDAAVFATEPGPDSVVQALDSLDRSPSTAANALRLARASFRLEAQRATFWDAVDHVTRGR